MMLSACGTISAMTGSDKPADPLAATTMCGPESPLEEADRNALCGRLATFKEPALPESWPQKTSVYRVLLLSPTQPSFSIRIEPQKDGAKLTVRKLQGGKLSLDRSVDLSEAEAEKFLSLIVKNIFWGLPVRSDVSEMPTAEDETKPCTSGIAFVVEGFTLGRYHFVRAHCRPTKQLEEISTSAFDLAVGKVPELSQGIATSLD